MHHIIKRLMEIIALSLIVFPMTAVAVVREGPDFQLESEAFTAAGGWSSNGMMVFSSFGVSQPIESVQGGGFELHQGFLLPEIPLKLLQVTPGSEEEAVSITKEITIQFNKPINLESVEDDGIIVTGRIGRNSRTISGNWNKSDEAGKSLIFKHDKQSFGDEEEVTVTITTKVEDIAGNPIQTKVSITFTTGIGVWPGDANNDGQADILDILPLGQHWHKTGAARDPQISDWKIQPAVPWKPDKMATYADTDGNSEVNEKDIMPIAINWRLSHPKKQLASPNVASEKSIPYNPQLLNIYEAMYDVLETAPFETEGVRALKGAIRELVSNIKRQLIPNESKLLQNYPNPFNPETWIPYQLSEGAFVRINIYDVTGRLVRTIEIGQKPAGYYLSKKKAAYWDGRNQIGEQVASGVYFYHLQAGKFENIKKLIHTK